MMRSYFNRFNNSYHYESAQAVIMAIDDVLKGEPFWEGNLDLSERRRELSALTVNEKLVTPLAFGSENTTPHSPHRNASLWHSFLRRITLNGHRLPAKFFHRKAVQFPLNVRAHQKDSFRRKSTVTFDPSSQTGYICHIDRDRFFANRKAFNAAMRRLIENYDALQAAYRENRQKMTTRDAWRSRFEGS